MVLTQRFEDALAYAAHLHSQQVRKASNVPYIAHLMGVTSLVLDYGGDEDEAVAALLHDAVEDQGGQAQRAEIARRFGERVAVIVDDCSDTNVIPKPPWRARKEAYLAHLPTVSDSARLVSAADKLHNVRSILLDFRQVGETVWERFNGGREGTLWYYRALTDTYKRLGAMPLVAELDRAVTELEALAGSGPQGAALSAPDLTSR